MNWNWETIKERAQIVYAKLSQLLIFLAVCFYLLACIVAGWPVGPRAYVSFTHHCFQWRPDGPAVTTQASLKKRDLWAAKQSVFAVRRARHLRRITVRPAGDHYE